MILYPICIIYYNKILYPIFIICIVILYVIYSQIYILENDHFGGNLKSFIY